MLLCVANLDLRFVNKYRLISISQWDWPGIARYTVLMRNTDYMRVDGRGAWLEGAY